MEYTVNTTHMFQQVVETLISALNDKGFTVRRSFDLQSALEGQAERVANRQAERGANYCILAVEPASTPHSSPGSRILVIYQYQEQPSVSLLRAVAPLPRRPAAEATSSCLESALVDLLLEKGWWSMKDVQTDL